MKTIAQLTKPKDVIAAFLRLTKCLPVSFLVSPDHPEVHVDTYNGLLMPALKFSVDFVRENFGHVVREALPSVERFFDTFLDDWLTVSDVEQGFLWAEAAKHYFSTYGLDMILSAHPDMQDTIVQLPQGYIPPKLKVPPQITKFQVIGIIQEPEIVKAVESAFYQGLALSKQSIADYLVLADFIDFTPDPIKVRNQELLTRYYARNLIIPEDPTECVRLLQYLLTGDTLLIQSDDLFDRAKNNCGLRREANLLHYYFTQDILRNRTKELASVFYRYKKLLLSLRYCGFKAEINRVRRLAKKYWQPLPKFEFLSTQILQKGDDFDLQQLGSLKVVDLVKIYNKLSYLRASDVALDGKYHEIFMIRNGKYYVQTKAHKLLPQDRLRADKACDYIKTELKRRLNPAGKIKIRQPEKLCLSFPTSEKSFIGDIPLYSQIHLTKEASVIGVAWPTGDVDLSAILSSGQKIGWDSFYKTDDQTVLYSGDCTRGGAEALYFDAGYDALIMLNLYDFNGDKVDLFVSAEPRLEFQRQEDHNYMVNPKHLIFSTKVHLENPSQTLGVYHHSAESGNFTFAKFLHGRSNVSRSSATAQTMITVLRLKGSSALKISDIFGVAKETESSDVTVRDLRNLSRTSILELINPV